MITPEELRQEILLAKGTGRLLPLEKLAGIIVLSAPPAKQNERVICEWTDENINRIDSAYNLFRLLAGRGRNVPWIMLNGERNQLPMMLQAALEIGIPAGNIVCADCGARPDGNTKTQFQILHDQSPRDLEGNVIVITSWYHMARVARTIPKNAPQREGLRYWVHSGGAGSFVVPDEIIEGEVQRILRYIASDDLVETPPPYLPYLLEKTA